MMFLAVFFDFFSHTIFRYKIKTNESEIQFHSQINTKDL